MSSILQNGYAILLSNTSDLDNYLLSKDKLLHHLTQVKLKKTKARDAAIAEFQDNINKVDTYLGQLVATGTNSAGIDKYSNIKARLENQLTYIKAQNINASYDDVRETHAFFINTTFRPLVSVAYGYSITNTTPLPLFGSSTRIMVPINGDFVIDQALHIQLSPLTATHKENKIRWYDFIGHRMIKEVRLVCNGIVLDRYGTEEMEMYYHFHVSKNQKYGWMRCVGQETPHMGTFIQDPTNQEVRERKLIYNGLQTPKHTHDAQDLYIPLLFWYNMNPAFALSNWNITYSKFWIEIDFETADNCIQIIDYAGDGGLFKYPTIDACDLITNHVYTIPEVSELFKHQAQFSIIRIHKRVERIVNKQFDSVNISDIKFAVENLYVRFRPLSNEQDSNAADIWRNNDVSTYKELRCASIIKTAGITSLAYTPAYYYDITPAVDTISFVSDGNVIYDIYPGVFYSSYIPLRFGEDRITTPDEDGAYLMTFSIFPGEAQPSGYLNFSQSREQHIEYQSSYIDIDHPVSLSVCANCINFLVLMDGSMSIRYAT